MSEPKKRGPGRPPGSKNKPQKQEKTRKKADVPRDSNGRWLPGHGSPNPAGRPRQFLTSILRTGLSDAEKSIKLVRALYDAALKGDIGAQRMIWDRMDGKLPDLVDLDAQVTSMTPAEAEESLLISWLSENEPAVLEKARTALTERRLEAEPAGAGGNGQGGVW